MQTQPEVLSRTFGGKRALAATLWYGSRVWIGAFASYRRIDWPNVSRVVFVCSGNICRSPYAERKFMLSGSRTLSAGLAADPGKPADVRALRVARLRGVDLKEHRSRALTDLPLSPGDLLVAFEPTHADALAASVHSKAGVQVTLLGLWSSPPWWVYLQDPYGLSEAYFDNCFRRIEQGIAGILHQLEFSRNNGSTSDE